jgi:crotonobetainyl-CoA:carnitine CoA-transferase CaiB-like acyl-CoA transferase
MQGIRNKRCKAIPPGILTDYRYNTKTVMSQLYLSHIKILDLTRVLAGPLATMMLADMGADVIKIERPGQGDDTRGWGPPFDAAGVSAYYLSVNRNKLSVAADLDNKSDLALIRGLAARADVVVENFRPASLAHHGLDPAALLGQLPDLIWCTITGFGPESDRAGYDFVVQAEQGWMSITGEPDGKPMKIGVALADVLAGKDAAAAILGALVARTSRALDAESRHIRISLAHSAIAALVNVAQNVLVTGAEAKRWGNAHPNLVPYQIFEAADRPIAIAVGTDAQWRALSTALELPALAADPELATNSGRVNHRARVVTAIADRVRSENAAHWLERLAKASVPSGLVRSVREALSDVDASPLTGVPPATPGSVRYPPPRLDEHGALVRKLEWDAFNSSH